MSINYKPVVLCILDGWGEWDTKMGNPMAVAELPTIERLNKYYPKLLLEASGLAVGLPWGIFGNSEVGHQTMGSGQIMYHYLPTITMQIQGGEFFRNDTFLKTIAHVKEHKTKLHLMGLVSDGGVHSHVDHLFALLDLAEKNGIEEVYIHIITDGRDTAPQCAGRFIELIKGAIKRTGVGKIATLVGRHYAMDRNKNWDRTEIAFRAFTEGEGRKEKDPLGALDKQYDKNITDEYMEPMIFTTDDGSPVGLVENKDAIIFYNFRPDRARQITRGFIGRDFHEFKKAVRPEGIYFTSFIEYQKDLNTHIVFEPQEISVRIGQILSAHDKKQLRIAETEKYAHVTYFFNGGEPEPFPGEDRIFVPSKKVDSYATIPEMSLGEVNSKLLDAIKNKDYDFILVNYANPDMVGHTGDFKAGIRALEYVDEQLNKLINATLKKGGCLLITADHGNIEEMVSLETGVMDTAHSSNPVPFWYVTPDNKRQNPSAAKPEVKGMIADVAPTILELLGIERPDEMVGIGLFDRIPD